MTAMCGADHPSLPITCEYREDATRHEEHMGFQDGDLVEWPNEGYTVQKVSSPKNNAAKLVKVANTVHDRERPAPVEEPSVAAETSKAIRQVDAAADAAWKAAALEVVHQCAKTMEEFTADEVWAVLEKLDASTHEPSALGPVFLRAKRQGWIENTGRRRNRSVYARRHRELTIWRSLLSD